MAARAVPMMDSYAILLYTSIDDLPHGLEVAELDVEGSDPVRCDAVGDVPDHALLDGERHRILATNFRTACLRRLRLIDRSQTPSQQLNNRSLWGYLFNGCA